MPTVDPRFLECVFYLYHSRDDAEKGKNIGGTGFFTSIRSKYNDKVHYVFAVSNKHVVHTSGASVIRLNTADGGTDIIEYEPHEWTAHPDGDDVAILPMRPNLENHSFAPIPDNIFVNKEIMEQFNIGIGADVCMFGRFINHEGTQRNMPSVRFGNISIMPSDKEKIRQQNGFMQESFAVEMRSIPGYSGSPVFAYNPSGNNKQVVQLFLVGIDWGFIIDHTEVKTKIIATEQAIRAGEKEVQYVAINTGMSGVVPAWKLYQLMHLPQFESRIAQEEEILMKKVDSQAHNQIAKK